MSTPVEHVPVFILMTDDAIADAAYFGPRWMAFLEYTTSDQAPLRLVERLTGWRSFTGSNGVTIGVRVGWRAALADALGRLDRDMRDDDE